MRAKKNREVNIFSASVVDLFASGLGVFLIVSIIALVNQKKESAQFEKSRFVFKEDGDEENLKLKEKVDQLKSEIYLLKIKKVEKSEPMEDKNKIIELKLKFASQKSELIRYNEQLKQELEAIKEKLAKSTQEVDQLKFREKYSQASNLKAKEGIGDKFSEFQIGSKIRLENVQFYPGTDRPIEPYASREIGEFAEFMKKNPMVIVEVSGHIFETKKAIEEGKAEDKYNLSGKRARKVCEILIKFGVADKRLNCIGYGATRSIHLTDDQYSVEAQMNRRVEIEILSK